MGKRAPTAMSPAALHVLLAIGPVARHGYAIMSEVERITDGAVRMGAGTLYGTLKRLLADGLIEECPAPATNDRDDERRRYYRLTVRGETAASAEVARMEALLRRYSRKTGAVHPSTR